MLSLLSCSVSRLDDFDTYTQPIPPSPSRRRSISRSLGFIKTTASPNAKKPTVAKMNIGSPTDFRHKLHLGKEVGRENMIALWDSTRWQQELEKVHDFNAHFPSLSEPSQDSMSSPRAFIAPSSPSTTKPNGPKRSSIPPQKRKPVPSLVPVPSAPFPVSPHEIPLPPSPTTAGEGEVQEDLPSIQSACHLDSWHSLDETAEVKQEPMESTGDAQASSQLRI